MIRLNRKGFTLVEIMIVVAIIALLAAIAIPNLLSARRTANEAAAQSTLKSFATAMEVYSAGVGSGQYPAAVDILSRDGGEFPYELDTTTRGGYTFNVTYAADDYTALANSPGDATGAFDFRITTGAVLERNDWEQTGSWTAIP